MLRIKIVLVLLFCLITTGYAQSIHEFGGRLGFGVNNYEIQEKAGLTKKHKTGDLTLFFALYNRNTFKKNDRFSWSYGVGVAREYLKLKPMIMFKEISELQDLNFDTLLVAEVANWEWQLSIPIDLSFQLFDQIDVLAPILVFPGMRLNVGIENRFTFNRIQTDNIVLSYYDPNLMEGYEYYNEYVNKRVSEYYSDNIPRYKLLLTAGFELFQESDILTAFGGLKFNHYLTSPINGSINNEFSMTCYIVICFNL